MDKTRIYGKAVEIDSEQVKDFYNERAKALKDSLSTVNLQADKEASLKRDIYEKEHIIPKLRLNLSDNVLELGCGFGRFAEALTDKISTYLGVDISDELIKLAKSKFNKHANFKFVESNINQLNETPNVSDQSFTLFLAMGILMYLNDNDVKKLFELFCKTSAQNARVYIRESVALIPDRLTLNGFWSDKLRQNYTAIYRTIPEYNSLFQPLIDRGFQLKESGPAYPPVTKNTETTQFYFIFTR